MEQDKEEKTLGLSGKFICGFMGLCCAIIASLLAFAAIVSLAKGCENAFEEYPLIAAAFAIAGALVYGLVLLAKVLKRLVARNAMIRAFTVVYFMSLTDTKRTNHNKPWRYGD